MSDDIKQLLSRAVYSPEELQSLKEALCDAIVHAEADGRIRDSIRLKNKLLELQVYYRCEYRKCGKPSCRCARRELHGPYLVLRYHDGGYIKRKYLGRKRKKDSL
jgi:hypothetical protein